MKRLEYALEQRATITNKYVYIVCALAAAAQTRTHTSPLTLTPHIVAHSMPITLHRPLTLRHGRAAYTRARCTCWRRKRCVAALSDAPDNTHTHARLPFAHSDSHSQRTYTKHYRSHNFSFLSFFRRSTETLAPGITANRTI